MTTDRTPFVLLPGLLDDVAMWVHQVAGLDDIARPVPINLTDHDTIGDSARHVLDNAPPRFALAGFSMGGYVAFEILRQARERISAVALISTSARADTPDRLDARKAMITRAEAGDYAALVDELLPLVVHPDRACDAALTGAIRDMALRIGADAFVRQLKVIMSRPDSRGELGLIDCPCLILCGNEDTLTPSDQALEMHDGIAGSEIELIETCGHYSPMEQPEAVTRLLRHWLARTTG